MGDRLARQIEFLLEADGAKRVLRRNPIGDGSRRENDAEHMWHLALMALVLAEHAAEPLDLGRVLQMLLVHDLVEIDAGDTFVYDDEAQAGKAERERAAAERIFGLLPPDQGDRIRALWEEFEERATPEARFAAAIDRLQPILMNHRSRGGAWRTHGITRDRVLARNVPMQQWAPELWEVARAFIADAVRNGYLETDEG